MIRILQGVFRGFYNEDSVKNLMVDLEVFYDKGKQGQKGFYNNL